MVLFTRNRGRTVRTALHRCTIMTLAWLMLLAGCQRYRRPCSSSTPDRKDRSTDDRGFDSRGVIRPRDSETIPSTNVPTTPRPFIPDRELNRTETYSPTRPTPKLGWNEPYLNDPLLNIDSSTTDLPTPATTEPKESKKFWITPDGTPQPEAKKLSSDRATPDRGVLLEPVAPKSGHPQVEESTSPLPTITNDFIQRSSNRPTIIEDRVALDTSKPGLSRLASVRGVVDVFTGDRPTLEGLDSLKKAGFSTVIFFHQPKADTAPALQLCEQRGLTLVAVPFSTGELFLTYSSFTKALAKADRGKAYVCDEANGMHTGAMWYGYFRKQLLLSADVSLLRAQSLGLPVADRIPEALRSALSQEFDNK